MTTMDGAEDKEDRRRRARKLIEDVRRMAAEQGLNWFLVTDGASGIGNNGNPAVRNAREAQIKWELEHGADPSEDWSKQAQDVTPEEISKSASSKKETWESGEGEVESYTKDKTRDHDEIVLRLKSGKKLVISNNTRLGVRVEPDEGDEIGYNGYRIDGTNVVHKVHPSKRQRGGWLDRIKSAGFTKKADPPNKGIHDPNPAIRFAHRNFGFVPQAPESYLRKANTPEQFYDVTARAFNHMGDPNSGGYYDKPDSAEYIFRTRPTTPEELHAYNYLRHSGALNNSSKHDYDENGRVILLGSYPYDSDKILSHEYGHFLSDLKPAPGKPWLRSEEQLRKYWKDEYAIDPYSREVAAWDEAGVPKDDPTRVFALRSYKRYPGSTYALEAASASDYKKPDDRIAELRASGVPVYKDVPEDAIEIARNTAQGDLYDYIDDHPDLVDALLEDSKVPYDPYIELLKLKRTTPAYDWLSRVWPGNPLTKERNEKKWKLVNEDAPKFDAEVWNYRNPAFVTDEMLRDAFLRKEQREAEKKKPMGPEDNPFHTGAVMR